MLDFEVHRCTRKCATTDRELRPGETVYSTLVSEGGEVKRIDYSATAWSGAPEGILGWWKFVIPDHQARKLKWAPSDIIRNYFKQLEDCEEDADKRYILALLLVRRRLMRLEETETDSEGREVLVLYCSKDETEHTVVVKPPAQERVQVIQDELAQLLFAGADEPDSEDATSMANADSAEAGDVGASESAHSDADRT